MSDQNREQEQELTPEGRPKIKVTDRRLFDADGNYRGDDAAAQPAANVPDAQVAEPGSEPTTPTGTPPPPAAPQPPGPAAPGGGSDVTRQAPRPATGQPAGSAAGADDATEFDDQAVLRFIEEQYIGGLLALGAMPEPQSGQTVEDLDLAQVRIEMLGLMQERFGDSLPAEAKKGLDDVLYQLRMAYLQKRKVAKL